MRPPKNIKPNSKLNPLFEGFIIEWAGRPRKEIPFDSKKPNTYEVAVALVCVFVRTNSQKSFIITQLIRGKTPEKLEMGHINDLCKTYGEDIDEIPLESLADDFSKLKS